MYAIDVAVLSGGRQLETLTYFSSDALAPLSAVMVPLRKKDVRGIVIGSTPVSDIKGEVKAQDFALRKVSRVLGEHIFRESYRAVGEELASFYFLPQGTIFRAIIPFSLFDAGETAANKGEMSDTPFKQERLILMQPFDERLSYYKSLVRESFARGESIAIVVPTVGDAELFASHLSHGIEEYTVVLHGERKQKDEKRDIARVIKEEHPLLMIMTPSYLALPRHDICTLVLEKEASPHYIDMATSIDMRHLAERVSAHEKWRIIYADTFVRVETYARSAWGEYGSARPLIYRLPEGKRLTLIDMKDEKEGGGVVIGATLAGAIRASLERERSVFLFSLRKGLATQILCQDCGDTITCKRCASVLILRTKGARRVFWCPSCERAFAPDLTCTRCGSWRLVALGIGVETVATQAKALFPDRDVIHVESDMANEKEARKITDRLEKKPAAILVGSQRALALLPSPVATLGVASFDSLLYMPYFGIGERILSLISSLWDATEQDLYIQTRDTSATLLHHLVRGSLGEWYREELDLRLSLGYPPATHLLLLEIARDTHSEAKEAAEKLVHFFSPYHPSLIERPGRPPIILLKIPRKTFDVGGPHDHILSHTLRREKEYGSSITWNPPRMP